MFNCGKRHPVPGLPHIRWGFLSLAAMLVLAAVLLAVTPAPAEAADTRTTWRPPPTLGMQDNVLYMKRVGDWQVTCYRRTFVLPLNDACELRLHERQYVTGHQKPVFVFDLVIEVAEPSDSGSQNNRKPRNDLGDLYDFNIMLDATPTPTWADATIRTKAFQMKIEDVCLVGACILRHQAAERLINEFVDATGSTAIISFRDAPLTDSYAKRRIGVPLDEFDQALSLLIEQTQHYRGY